MTKPTDPEVQSAIIQLRDEGWTYGDIARKLDLSKSTVRNVLKRAKCGADGKKRTGTDSYEKIPARARDKSDAATGTGTGTGTNTGTGTPSRSALDDLTKQRTAEEMMEYLRITKAGYENAKKSDQDDDKRVWQEVQYLKLYKEAVKMMIDCTGLTKDAIEALPVSPVDSYLTGSLEVIKAKEEQTDGGSD